MKSDMYYTLHMETNDKASHCRYISTMIMNRTKHKCLMNLMINKVYCMNCTYRMIHGHVSINWAT